MEQSRQADLNHLKSFFWVARSGSFTHAAKALGIPKSTLSQHLRMLETRLGTTLIQRTTRRLALTEAGALFLTYCQRALSEIEDAERAVTQYRSEPRGLLRVGVPVTFARSFLSPLLPSFCRRYPEVQVELAIPGRIDPVAHLLDIVIRTARMDDSSYVVKKLGEVSQGLFASRSYLGERGAPKSLRDLPGHSLISISRQPEGAKWQLTDGNGKKQEVSFEPRLAVADPVVAAQLAAADLGIASIPHFLARDVGALAPVLPDWRPPCVEFFAVYPARHVTPPKVSAFLEMLEAGLSHQMETVAAR
ncbi:MAG: LysR family transcriptional regulator [Bryobacteraceae bacterium]|nr:LysR family transcriptional regulator [Bryobacteraceae bacterium]